jgi:cell wall assembly regulator SMI1
MMDAERRLLEMILRETPDGVRELIGRLDQWLRLHRPDYHSQLQPGARGQELDQFEEHFALKLPVSFRMLYEWRNGQREECSASLEHNRMFLSLESITSTKETLDGMIGEDFGRPEWWRIEWVPFLANGGGDLLCLDLASTVREIPARVIAFWHDGDDRSVKHPSLKVWLNRLVSSMEDGTYKVC